MISRAYSTDLSDQEWAVLAPLLPSAKSGGRPRSVDLHRILDGIFYVLRSGCQWRLLPREFPPWSTVYDYFRKWRNAGVWERLNTALREQVRQQAGRERTPSAAIIDSQSVKVAERGGPHGYDGGKKVNGRKRHILVDTLGLLLKVVIHPANLQDREGAKLVLEGMPKHFPRLAHLWADSAYGGPLMTWITETLGWSVTIVRHPPPPSLQHEIIYEDPSDWRKGWVEKIRTLPPPKGFRGVLPRRWVVERSFAWIGRNRRMSKDYEYQLTTSEAWIYLSMIRLMLKRLAREQVVPDFHYRRVA